MDGVLARATSRIGQLSASRSARGVRLAAVLGMMGAATACRSQAEREADIANGDDPLAALTVSAPSTRYTTRYWLTQVEHDPTLWANGAAYCEQQRSAAVGTKPNCAAVYEAQSDLSVRKLRPPRARAGQKIDSLMFRP